MSKKKKNVKVGMTTTRTLSKKICYFLRENNCNGDTNIDLTQYNQGHQKDTNL